MTITLIDYQLLVLLVAAWASGCVTLYVSEERRARKEYHKRRAQRVLEVFKGDEASLVGSAVSANEYGLDTFTDVDVFFADKDEEHINEAMKIANGEDNKED